ncbi:MAG: hypothetical protein AAGI10_04320 [Pseudomonadota bacterium]
MSKRILLSTLLAVVAAPAAYADTTAAGLDGAWKSLSCEVRPQPNQDGTMGEWWLTRDVVIESGRIEADFITYAGPGCGFPLQVLSFAGSVDVLGPSDVLEGAVEADLTIDEYVRFTPLAQGFADFLNSAEAGTYGTSAWEVGSAGDVLETGCSVLGLPANSPTVEFEVLGVVADHLYFGERPVDGSFLTLPEGRPKALLAPLVRQ